MPLFPVVNVDSIDSFLQEAKKLRSKTFVVGAKAENRDSYTSKTRGAVVESAFGVSYTTQKWGRRIQYFEYLFDHRCFEQATEAESQADLEAQLIAFATAYDRVLKLHALDETLDIRLVHEGEIVNTVTLKQLQAQCRDVGAEAYHSAEI